VFRSLLFGSCALLTLVPSGGGGRFPLLQEPRATRELIADLDAVDAAVRARAACGLRELGDRAAGAIAPLVKLLADGSPVEGNVCGRRWWHGGTHDLTSPGEQAASALAAIGSQAFQPVLAALRQEAWIARRNAAWALGALDDNQAVPALIDALRDREAPVREQAAWALGAIDDTQAMPVLIAALKDQDARVRRQAAWALGAIDDPRAVTALGQAVEDAGMPTKRRARRRPGRWEPSTTVPRCSLSRARSPTAHPTCADKPPGRSARSTMSPRSTRL